MAVFYIYIPDGLKIFTIFQALPIAGQRRKKGFEQMLGNFQPSTHRGIKNFKKKFSFEKELRSPLFFKMERYVSFIIHHSMHFLIL